MKFIAIILLCFFGWFSGTPFKQIDATEQTTMGGRQESGKSVNYSIKFVVKHSSKKLVFNDLWLGVDNVDIFLRKADGSFLLNNQFERGDTILVVAYKRYLPNRGGVLEFKKEHPDKSVPKEYEGNAILKYTLKGKVKYYIIPEFSKLSRVNMP